MTKKHTHLDNRYMLSYIDKKEIRWVRQPFMSKYQLNGFLFQYAKDPNRFQHLEIFKEPTLNTNVIFTNEENSDVNCTLRECLFGKFYQENVVEYETNEEFRNFFDAVRN